MSLDADRVMANVRNHLPGVLDPVVQYELYNILNDFFQVTNAWQEAITFYVNGDGVTTDYQIEQSSVSTINRLMNVVDSSNIPVAAIMATPGDITLQRAPTVADTYTATVALTIDDPVGRDGFPEFPSWILPKYNLGIIDGVIGRLMAQPAKPYSNPQIALVRTKSYIAVRSRAKAEVLHSNLNNGQTWSFPQNFRSVMGQRF